MKINIDSQDIQSLITLIEAKVDPQKIINFIKAYIFNPDKNNK
jgi:hypothetical protein